MGWFKCNKPRCEVCINVIETDTFASTAIGESFKTNHKFNCDDKCLIYLLTCNQCRKQYVGQTVDRFRFRWNNYKCNCHKHAKSESVKQQHLYDHLMLEHYTQFVNDASIMFIDKKDPADLLKREQYWRHTLKTWCHMAFTFLKVYDCTILVNYYKGWTVLGLSIWIRTRIWKP